MLLRQLRTSPHLKEEIARFDRSRPHSYDHSYDYLYSCSARRIELTGHHGNRASILAHQAKGEDLNPSAPGPRPKANPKKKGIGKSNAKSNGGDGSNRRQSRGTSQTPKEPDGVCYSYCKTGACSREACQYEHTRAPNPKAKANGKAHDPADGTAKAGATRLRLRLRLRRRRRI